MTGLIEILWVYFVYLLPWPGTFVAWAIHDGGLPYLAGWIAIGVPVVWALNRFAGRVATLGWIVVWFMPGTIICGDATLWPWAMTLLAAFNEGGCSTPLSLSATLAANVVIVLAAYALIRRLRRPRP